MPDQGEGADDGAESIDRPTRRARTHHAAAEPNPPTGSRFGRTPSLVDPTGVTPDPAERRYRHRRVLGRGGMGEVKLVDDQRIGRSVAVKILLDDETGNIESVARFLREARVQGQLEHPSIVPVYDVDEDDAGRVFFTMRRIDGDTLERILTRLAAGDEHYLRLYSRRKLLSIFLNVCLALEYAHASGVVHRDLKPSNVMIGNFGEVHVLDWGIAKVRGVRDSLGPISAHRDDAATRQGTVLGTPGFMAPEQLVDPASVDARSDVYALGSLLFSLLTHESLHRGDGDERLRSTERGADARASVRKPELDIAPELDAICVRATAQRPEDRYPSARALHDAVERFLEGDRDDALRAELERRKLDEGRSEAQGALAPLGALALAGLLPTWLVFDAFGIRSTSALGFLFGAVAVAALHALYVGLVRPRAYRTHAILLTVPVAIAIAASAALFGPLFFTPTLALVVASVVSVLPGLGRERFATIGLVVLAMFVPFVAEWAGLLPPAYDFAGGRIAIRPQAVEFPEAPTRVALFAANLMLVLVVSAFLYRAIAGASSAADVERTSRDQ